VRRGPSGLASSTMSRAGLELQPDRELDLALAPCQVSNDPGRPGIVTVLENDEFRCVEVRVIEGVEDLDPELRGRFS
jgi:hypothetical protein